MMQRISNAAFLIATMFLIPAALPAQANKNVPATAPNGDLGRYGITPTMQSNGPTAPQNNIVFAQQHVSDAIRRNMETEIALSEMALKRSHNAIVKKFAHEVITANQDIDQRAKAFAPNNGKAFADAGEEGTRQAIETRDATAKMKTLTGAKFDQLYLVTMYKYSLNDEQVGHSAYAMMQIPGVSPVGWKYWNLARKRSTQIETIAKQVHVTLPRR